MFLPPFVEELSFASIIFKEIFFFEKFKQWLSF